MRIHGHSLIRQACLHLPECEQCQGVLAPQGHGLCACGQVGVHVTSYAARRRWHNDHLLFVHEHRMGEGITKP